MDFGMPTLIENRNLEENITLCKELDLKFIELNMNLPEYQIEKLEEVYYFKEAAQKAGIYFTIHLDENLNIADFNQGVANAYMETVKRTIGVAKELGVPVLNMHMNHGVHFTLPDRKVQLFEQYFEDYIGAFRKFMNLCEEEIGDSDIKICIENTNGFRSYEQSAVKLLLQSEVFGLTWDIGHSNGSGNIDEPFILQNENRLNHFHIHDSLGRKDHMTLGTGEIDLESRLNIAKKHQCRCVVETKTIEALRKSVVWLRENELSS
ncbi:MAG: sugar phosphate isomerase/epimerase [Lachnospiraceae bacterium]|nr:sugar phosphate isomerase/epimerase [Lachnospiraceae bacterium]